MTWAIVLTVVLAVLVAVGLAVSLAELRRAEQQMSGDWCRVCMCDLPRGKVYELRTGHEAADDGMGGTYLSQTFCRKHAPAGAIQH